MKLETLKQRLERNRPMTHVTIRMPKKRSERLLKVSQCKWITAGYKIRLG